MKFRSEQDRIEFERREAEAHKVLAACIRATGARLDITRETLIFRLRREKPAIRVKDAVPDLVRRGWLRSVGYRPGNAEYFKVTLAGYQAVGVQPSITWDEAK